jgi:thiazole/oxazole-forming peptide maturase SagD family component
MPEPFASNSFHRVPSLVYGPIMITDPTLGCPITVAAGRVRAAREEDLTPRFASGWGTTFEEAAINCQYEAEETYLAQMVPEGLIRRALASELGRLAIEPASLMLFSDAQYRDRDRESASGRKIPIRWKRSRPIDWIQCDARFSTREAWAPAGLCFLGYGVDAASGVSSADSNGLARGSSLEDAVVRGFCEVAERDATAIWWYNRLIVPRINLHSVEDELVWQYAQWLQIHDRELRLLHLTLDIPISIVAAVSNNDDGGAVALGFAAGRSMSKAARRAVGELAECEANLALLKRTASLAGTAGFTSGALQLYQWHEQANIRHHPHLSGGGTMQATPMELQLDWRRCYNMCRERDLDLFSVDLTQDSKSPVARVFVPNLRSTKPRFAAGRLYDVPVRLGLKSSLFPPIAETPFPL